MEDSRKNINSPENNTVKEPSEEEMAATLSPEQQQEFGEILDKLDPDEKEIISTMISYSGPLPPPALLKGYSEVFPEAPNKIFTWVEEQQNHRHKMERRLMDKTFSYRTFGMISGLIIALVFIMGAFSLILLDKEAIGISLLGPVILGVIGILVLQNRKDKNQNESETEGGEE